MTEKHKAICPVCKTEVIDDCYGCIIGNTLVCSYCEDDDGFPTVYDDVKWEKLCT